jgi:hypothetical protein
MAENKTKATNASVENFLNSIPDEKKRQDAFRVLELMQDITKEKAIMWGSSMVGFGSYHYKYASGHEGDTFLTGFSPRKQDLTIYINTGFEPHKDLMEQLGKYKTGKVCLYIKKLDDIKLPVLKKLIKASYAQTKKLK